MRGLLRFAGGPHLPPWASRLVSRLQSVPGWIPPLLGSTYCSLTLGICALHLHTFVFLLLSRSLHPLHGQSKHVRNMSSLAVDPCGPALQITHSGTETHRIVETYTIEGTKHDSRWICEFQASLFYKASLEQPRALSHRETVSQKNKKQKKKRSVCLHVDMP